MGSLNSLKLALALGVAGCGVDSVSAPNPKDTFYIDTRGFSETCGRLLDMDLYPTIDPKVLCEGKKPEDVVQVQSGVQSQSDYEKEQALIACAAAPLQTVDVLLYGSPQPIFDHNTIFLVEGPTRKPFANGTTAIGQAIDDVGNKDNECEAVVSEVDGANGGRLPPIREAAVIIHEALGHLLGVDHAPDASSDLMTAVLPPKIVWSFEYGARTVVLNTDGKRLGLTPTQIDALAAQVADIGGRCKKEINDLE